MEQAGLIIEEYASLIERKRGGFQDRIQISFKDIVKISPELAEAIIEDPELYIQYIKISILDRFDKKLNIRIKDFDIENKTNMYEISDIRTEHIGKLVCVKGVIGVLTQVQPLPTLIKYECPNCGTILTVAQIGKLLLEPTRCPCGRKGSFKKIEEERINCQKMIIEEEITDAATQTQKLNVLLKEDMCEKELAMLYIPGHTVLVTGILRDIPKVSEKILEREFLLEALYVKNTEEDARRIKLNHVEIDEIINFSKQENLIDVFVDSFAPEIVGYDYVKKGLILQLIGGNKTLKSDGKIGRAHV